VNQPLDKSAPARWNTPAVPLAAATLLWLASLLIVNPLGDFPLNDDWSFGLAVKHLLAHGDFRPTGWTSMPLLTNALWGSLFCLPGGFSFTALRLSTLVAAWLGMVGAYLLGKELRLPPWLAWLATLTLAFNPIYYPLANTFITDVPFVALALSAALCFVKHLKDGSVLHLFLGTGLALAATLSRQVGLAVPLAFGLALLLRRGRSGRALLCAAAPALLCVAALWGFQHWLDVTGRMPALYHAKDHFLRDTLGHFRQLGPVLVASLFKGLMYLGLFLSPVLIATLPGFPQLREQRQWRPLGLTAAVLAGFTVLHGVTGQKWFLMPLAGNIINKGGIGPLTLRDVYRLQPGGLPALPASFWLVVTLISLLGATLLVVRVGSIAASLASRWRSAKLDETEIPGIFVLLVAVIYLAPFLTGFFDRYLIPIIPFLAAGIVSLSPPCRPARPRSHAVLAALITAGFVLFSVCGTRDYLAWNRVRWQALNDLTDHQRVRPEDIDGGLEFNGYYLYRPDYQTRPGRDFWWIEGDTYQITFHPLPGCSAVREYHFAHWLPPYSGSLWVLKADGPEVAPPGPGGKAAPAP
jgi:4-amino-4-deoxy-L-arabinose transferase-like glycosyltransferase